MAFKNINRRALKLHGVFLASLLVVILGLAVLMSLTMNLGPPNEANLRVKIPALKTTTQEVPAPGVKKSDGHEAGPVAVPNETGPVGSNFEKPNPQGNSPHEIALAPATEMSAEQLIFQAEAALAENASAEEKLAAIRSLENIDDPDVVYPVMLAMADQDPDLRKAALEVLRDMESEAFNEAFLAGLEDDHQEVTEKVMDILADSDSSSILPSLEHAVNDSDEQVQKTAISTLEDIYDAGAVDILIETGLHSDNEAIRNEIFDSLEFITDQRFESYQDAKIWWELNRDTFEFD